MTELRQGAPVTVGNLKIIPIEAVCCDRYAIKRGFCVSAFKAPAYVVVVTPSETHAFDMAGAEVNLQNLPVDLSGAHGGSHD